MPTKAQVVELVNGQYTTMTDDTVNGVSGTRFTSKTNGNSIFLPLAGTVIAGSLDNVGSEGYYWSTGFIDEGNAYYLGVNGMAGSMFDSYRLFGLSIRPVQGSNS